jgi:transposase
MTDKRTKYDEDFKKNAVQLSYASPKSVRAVAVDLGIAEALLYRWRKQYQKNGEPTEHAQMEAELKRLRAENAKLKMREEMLRKATAYFANQHASGMNS